ncbi:MAG: hypothetical protein RLZZ584_4197, partial [Pseudomonadota bacterium]
MRTVPRLRRLARAALLATLPLGGAAVAQAPAAAAMPVPPAGATSVAASAPAPVVAPAPAPAGAVLVEWLLPELRSLGAAELQALLQPWVGRAMTAAEVQAVRSAVAGRLEARGLGLGGVAVRPVAGRPGTWRLLVVEPRLRRIDFAPGADVPLSDVHVAALLERHGLRAGELLDLRALDQALYRLNDLPGVAASATLAPTGEEGVYDLVLERSLRKRLEGSAEFDNHGSLYNGRYRLGALLRVNQPLDIGDNLDARLLVSHNKGLVTARLGYELPLAWFGASAATAWDSGWRVSLGLSSLSYELGDSLAGLQAGGRARVVDAALGRTLMRSRQANLVGRIGLSHKALQDRFDALGQVTDKSASDVNAALSFEVRDELAGGGYSGGSLGLVAGRLAIRSADARRSDLALGERATSGHYLKLGVQASRLQALPALGPGWSLYGGLSAQWADRNLDASEKFALGGAQAVRAYAPGEAAADAGLITSLELRRPVGARWSVYGLVDVGRARLQMRPAADVDNHRSINARGVGAFFSDPALFTLRAVLAWRGDSAP